VTILPVEATTSQQIEKSFPQMVKVKAGALIVVSDGFFIQQARQIGIPAPSPTNCELLVVGSGASGLAAAV
jgi:hypothetical protein